MRIAVIGGSGFIGMCLVERLIGSGHEVRILDVKNSPAHSELWHYADVCDPTTLTSPLRGCEVLYNLASGSERDIDVQGARNVCFAAETVGIHRIIYISSVEVYGSFSGGTDESGMLNPETRAGWSKRIAEEIYRTWHFGSSESSLVIVRPVPVFGEKDANGFGRFLFHLARKNLMIGKGKNIISFAYVENIGAFLEYVLIFHRGEQVFNYSDKPHLDLNSLLMMIKKKSGLKMKSCFRIPYLTGLALGYISDFLSLMFRQKLILNSNDVKKMSLNSHYYSSKTGNLYFLPPYTFEEAVESTSLFVRNNNLI